MGLSEGSTLITLALIVVYFVVLLGIGVWASKKIKNSEDYMLAGHLQRNDSGWNKRIRICLRVAGNLGTDLCTACSSILYYLLRIQTQQDRPGKGLHDP